MRPVVARIIHPVFVNQRLMELQRARGTQLMRFVLLMERAETWPVDDIRTDPQGQPMGVNDDRGTAAERLHGLHVLEQVLNSPALAEQLQSPEATASGPVGRALIDVMAFLRTGRFLVCLHHLSTISPEFAHWWLAEVDERAKAGSVMAHVLRSRLLMLKRADMCRAVFSKEAVEQVVRTLERMK